MKKTSFDNISSTKEAVMEWIGGEDFIGDMTEEQAEAILNFLESENINIENNDDMQKVADFVASLL